ncbi:hypothetical protein F2P81_020507 [Scophthalmus maximus]|uniref:Uncharacterized protein n=1 Tax=Scophthalmus maximus TaxID=52904 RepID=A0A6A4RY69_SCOMX|nr:hypothetical protein F2P81_020507 [Scophthalmus maximus]
MFRCFVDHDPPVYLCVAAASQTSDLIVSVTKTFYSGAINSKLKVLQRGLKCQSQQPTSNNNNNKKMEPRENLSAAQWAAGASITSRQLRAAQPPSYQLLLLLLPLPPPPAEERRHRASAPRRCSPSVHNSG